ncbi:MAG: hypothetical protein OXI01_13205 [Albidovulum sp.]|nr:hypothetical protein [Albidovulum sp.]
MGFVRQLERTGHIETPGEPDDAAPDGLVVRGTKFGKSRLVVLHPTDWNAPNRYLESRLRETRTGFNQWLDVRISLENRYLFLNARGRAMGAAGFAYLLRKHAAKAAETVPSIKAKRLTLMRFLIPGARRRSRAPPKASGRSRFGSVPQASGAPKRTSTPAWRKGWASLRSERLPPSGP